MTNLVKRVMNLVNDVPIRLKFIIIYLALILMPMILVYGIFFTQLKDQVALRESKVLETSLSRVEGDILYLIEGCFAIARDLAVDQRINEQMNMDYTDSAAYFDMYFESLKDRIQMYATGYNNVIKVSLYTDNPSVLNGGNIYKITQETRETEWFQAMKGADTTNVITAWVEPHYLWRGQYLNRLSVIRHMDEYSQYRKEVYVRVDVEEGKLTSILEGDYDTDFVMTDVAGRILATTLDMTLLKEDEIVAFDPEPFQEDNDLLMRQIKPSEDTTWYMYAIVPKSTLTEQVNQYGLWIIIMFGGSLALSVLMIFLVSGSYNKRIHLLKKHMEKVENSDYTLIEGTMGKDEIGSLIRAFNRMTLRINGLVNEVLRFKLKEKEHQLEQVKAELKFLQSQMDPHFLFNTLNAILVVSMRHGYSEITDIIKYLSKTLRYLIEWDDSMVPISKELAFTNMYLQIEKFRFRDKFNYDMDVEAGVEQVLIPKMTIQPFIENACKHGLQATKGSGRLLIRVYRLRDSVNIIIEDNGIGMTQDQIEKILQSKSDAHIGVKNVMKRLKLHYGDNQSFSIKSKPGEGTTVSLKIPYRTTEEALTEEALREQILKDEEVAYDVLD